VERARRAERLNCAALMAPQSCALVKIIHVYRILSCYNHCVTSEELKGIVHSDAEIMGGTPVFVGTRVPLQNLIDYLEGGESIEDFLDGFPSVKREQVIAVIEAAKLKILEAAADARSH
jgi:uncharacterized protein (DUF433 family)